MMIFKVPKELAEQSMLACADCEFPVPNDMLEDAHRGTLGPCPKCGSTRLKDNPNCAMAYSKNIEYDGVVGLMFTHPGFEYARFTPFIPEVNTQRKKKPKNFMSELLDTVLANG